MYDCTFLIDDVRYSVPTLFLVSVHDKSRMEELARFKLEETTEHVRVQVFVDDQLIYSVSKNGGGVVPTA